MAQQDALLITTQCITLLNSDWRSKEEVLKGMTDNLLLAGVAATRVLEADPRLAEAVFSTGLASSFAIPHSKSEHIEQSTISVGSPGLPVAWGETKRNL